VNWFAAGVEEEAMENPMEANLIAPCGINCRLCYAYGRKKNVCPGCRGDDTQKMKSCLACHIKNCEKVQSGSVTYCFECSQYPCDQVKHLDKRYRTKYGTSVIENLSTIQENGMDVLLKQELLKWTCPECGALLCMHKPQCLACGYEWNK
jgi:hypothetical protein